MSLRPNVSGITRRQSILIGLSFFTPRLWRAASSSVLIPATAACTDQEPSQDTGSSRQYQASPNGSTSGSIFLPLVVAAGNAYYVSPNGDDANPGTENLPFRTLAQGVAILKPGDTLFVMPGIYAESLNASIPSGVDWNTPVTLKAYDPSNRPILKPRSGNDFVLLFNIRNGQAMHHIIVDGFILDAANVAEDNVAISDGAHHIRLINTEVKNAPQQGILTSQENSQFNEFINLDVHHNGVSDFNHGMYISTSSNLIDRCKVHDNAGWGIQIYNENAWQDDYNVISRNEVYNNARAGSRGVGIGLYSGTGHLAYNNIVWGNETGIAVDYNAISVKVFNNTVYKNDKNDALANVLIGQKATDTEIVNNIVSDHAVYGILHQSPKGSGALIKNNLIYNSTQGDIKDATGAATMVDNLEGLNPMFVDPTNADFRLQPNSPAIRRGITLTEVKDDFNGALRPRDASYDLGAYRYTG